MKLNKKLVFTLSLILKVFLSFTPTFINAQDPKTLQMVFVPASEKGDAQDFKNLINIISDRVGVKIVPIKVTDYNAAVESMRAGRSQIAWFGGKTYIRAAEIANAEAFAAGVRLGENNAGYYSYFIVRSDSQLEKIEDIQGQTLGLSSIGSTSGDLIPRVELIKVGLSTKNKNHFKRVVYAGSHDACLLAVINKHVDVCGMSSRNFDARIDDKTIKSNEVRIIHRSPLVPPPPLAYSKELSKGLRIKIKKATLEAHKYGKIGGYGGEMSHYIEVNDNDYDGLREIARLLNQ